MSDIDSLDIKIAASADKAVQSINTLITKLNEVKSALNMGNVANIVSNSMKNVGSSVENSMQKVEQTVEKTTKKIGRTFDDISKKYGHIGVGFDIAGASKETYQKYLNNFMNQQANALEKIQELEVGGKTGSQAYETAVKNYTILGNKIDSIVEKMRKMDMPLQTDEELEKVVSNAKRAGTAISEATKEEERFAYVSQNAGNYNASAMEAIFGKAASGIRNYQDAIDTFGVSAGKSMNDLNAKVENINIPLLTSKLGEATQQATSLGDVFRTLHVKNASAGMDKVQTEIDKVKRKYDELVDKIKLFNDYSNNYQNTRTYAEHQHKIDGLINDYARLIQMQEQLSREADKERVSQSFARMRAGVKKVFGVIGSLVSKIKQYVTHSKKAYSATELLKKATNNLTRSLTKVGRMFRMMLIRMALRKVIENIATGFKGLALYSEEFNQSISMLIGSLKQLGYSISAAVGPLVNAFAPAINKIIQLCITAVNYINQLISALSGKGTWIRAKKQVVDYAKSLKGAGKEAKGSLLALDELNNITTNSGGGSGSSDINPSDMYETVPIESNILNLADRIKEAWANADFTELGRMFGEWITNGLKSIPWEKIKETVNNVAKSIATFLNGFFSTPEMGEEGGKAIAELLNTAIGFVSTFVSELKWEEIGTFIGEAINGFFENFDFEQLAETINNLIDGIWKLLKKTIEETDWKKAGEKIKEFWDSLEPGAKLVLFLAAIPTIVKAIQGIIVVFTTLNSVVAALKVVFTSTFGQIGILIAGAITAIASFVDMWKNGYSHVKEILMLLGIAITAVMAIVLGVPAAVAGVIAAIVAVVATLVIVVKDHWTEIKDFVIKHWNTLKAAIIAGWEGFKKIFNIKGFISSITGALAVLLAYITGTFKGAWTKAWEGIKFIFKSAWNGIATILEGVVNGIIDGINNFTSGIRSGISGLAKLAGKDVQINAIGHITIPKFEGGGLVPNTRSYSLFAAGENGIPEILGTVGGRTAVAGGAEITGIRDAIYETASEEVVLLRQQNQLLQGILQKEFGISKSDIGKAARNYGKEYYDRTGDNAFVF